MDENKRNLVRQRAGFACEYCHMPQEAVSWATFHIEHIIARQHDGGDEADNLALACTRCNLYKGPNLSAIDPDSGNVVMLYHPRRDPWKDHFRFDGARIIGQTPIGRATVRLLQMNALHRVEAREEWLQQGGRFS